MPAAADVQLYFIVQEMLNVDTRREDLFDPVFNLEEEMDVSNTLWYKILTLLGRIICSLVGHSYPIDDNYCERCDHYYYD